MATDENTKKENTNGSDTLAGITSAYDDLLKSFSDKPQEVPQSPKSAASIREEMRERQAQQEARRRQQLAQNAREEAARRENAAKQPVSYEPTMPPQELAAPQSTAAPEQIALPQELSRPGTVANQFTPDEKRGQRMTQTPKKEQKAPAAAQKPRKATAAEDKPQKANDAQAKAEAKRREAGAKQAAKQREKAAAKKTAEKKKLIRKERKRRYRKQKAMHSTLSLFVTILIVAVITLSSLALKIPIMDCVNDIIAIDRSDTPITVYISADMNTTDVIHMLRSNGLIKNAEFCNLLASFLGFDGETTYYEGEHVLTADMGIEGMLNNMLSNADVDATVTITFPEGYTVDQIAEKLYNEKVIEAKNAFFNAIDNYEFTDDFAFLSTITNRVERYRALEGFLYPDTYEFYLDENLESIIERFLTNFQNKWKGSYEAKAEEMGYSVDYVIRLASIIQKEAKDADQMYTISSILHNRLNSETFTKLQFDSTKDYITNIGDGLLTQERLTAFYALYDTYECNGLPAGPICNPGDDAINAALYPDNTDYFYFCHDSVGNIYLAQTSDEHYANVQALNNQ